MKLTSALTDHQTGSMYLPKLCAFCIAVGLTLNSAMPLLLCQGYFGRLVTPGKIHYQSMFLHLRIAAPLEVLWTFMALDMAPKPFPD